MENKNPFLEKLKQRLRFVLFDDRSYQELKSMTLTRFQVLTRILSVFLSVGKSAMSFLLKWI